MRTREIWLFLLLVTIALTYHDAAVVALRDVTPARYEPPVHPLPGNWAYDPRSPYYSYLPGDVQEFRNPSPYVTAEHVCKALGGRVDFLQSPGDARETLGFNCRFSEPDMTITAEFGDLRRMPARK